jgi:hypothetical protein
MRVSDNSEASGLNIGPAIRLGFPSGFSSVGAGRGTRHRISIVRKFECKGRLLRKCAQLREHTDSPNSQSQYRSAQIFNAEVNMIILI